MKFLRLPRLLPLYLGLLLAGGAAGPSSGAYNFAVPGQFPVPNALLIGSAATAAPYGYFLNQGVIGGTPGQINIGFPDGVPGLPVRDASALVRFAINPLPTNAYCSMVVGYGVPNSGNGVLVTVNAAGGAPRVP